MILPFRHAIEIIEEYFLDYACDKQEFLEGDERINEVLQLCKDPDILLWFIFRLLDQKKQFPPIIANNETNVCRNFASKDIFVGEPAHY